MMTDPIADMLTRIRNANQMRNATVSMPSSNLKVEIAKFAPKVLIKATLYIDGKLAKNKKLTFTFKGKKYTAKTNGKGLASIIIKKSILKTLLAKEILLLWFILNQAFTESLSMSGNVLILEGNGEHPDLVFRDHITWGLRSEQCNPSHLKKLIVAKN